MIGVLGVLGCGLAAPFAGRRRTGAYPPEEFHQRVFGGELGIVAVTAALFTVLSLGI